MDIEIQSVINGTRVTGETDRVVPVVNPSTRQIVVQLDPPDVGGAWHLKVLAPGPDKRLVSIDVALVNAGSKRRELEADLLRDVKDLAHHRSPRSAGEPR